MDLIETLLSTEIKCLDNGYVKLVDFMPRLSRDGRMNVEHAIVTSARMSTTKELKSIEDDEKLIKYLYKNRHTSPFESVKFSFQIKCPIFVSRHLVRHRTANINESSFRYSVGNDEFFCPSSSDQYVRFQAKTNKQSSVIDSSKLEEATELMKKAEDATNQMYVLYKQMIDFGIARECARFCLPVSQYTEMTFTMDLNNLVKFWKLRTHESTQYETRVFAIAMFDLVRTLIPVTSRCMDDEKE